MNDHEPWLGFVTFSSGAAGEEFRCEAAVFCASTAEFATLVGRELERQNCRLCWYEEVAPATQYAHQGRLDATRSALSREVFIGKRVVFGALSATNTGKAPVTGRLLTWRDVIERFGNYYCVISAAFDFEFFDYLVKNGVPHTCLYELPGSKIPASIVFDGADVGHAKHFPNWPDSLILVDKDSLSAQDLLNSMFNVGFRKSRAFYSLKTIAFTYPAIFRPHLLTNDGCSERSPVAQLFLPIGDRSDGAWEAAELSTLDFAEAASETSIIKDFFVHHFTFIVRHILIEIYSHDIPKFEGVRDAERLKSLYCWPNILAYRESSDFVRRHIEASIRIAERYLSLSDDQCTYEDLFRLLRISAALSELETNLADDPQFYEILNHDGIDPYTKVCLVEYNFVVKPNRQIR